MEENPYLKYERSHSGNKNRLYRGSDRLPVWYIPALRERHTATDD